MMIRLPAAAGLATSVLLGPGCVGVNFDHEGHIEREQKRFEVGAKPEVAIYTFDGAVEVRSWDRNEVSVEVEKRGQDAEAVAKIQVLAEQTGNRVQVEARRPGGSSTFVGVGVFRSPSARMIANVPRAAHVVVRTGDGSILAERLDGPLELRTGDGAIRTLETAGDLLAESRDGSVQIEEASGRVEARTDDGSVRVSGTPRSVRVRSGDGTVVLRIRQGTLMTEDWMVDTADGSITVELPDGFNARIEADPGSDSRVRNDLVLANLQGGTRTERLLRGTLGSGGYLLSLRTNDGTIRLVRY